MRITDLGKKILKQKPQLRDNLRKDLSFQMSQVLTEARLTKGWTQSLLAKKMKTEQPTIARAESGVSLPSLSFLKTMAEAYDTYLIPPKFGFMEENYPKKQGIK